MKPIGWLVRVLALGAFTLIGVGSFCPTASAAPVVIDFETLLPDGPGAPASAVVNSQYTDKGITFNSPVALDYSKGSPLPGFAHSGTKAIEQCYSKEFCTTPIQMSFTAPQRRVKVWAGYRGPLTDTRTIIVRAFDASNAEVNSVTATLNPSATSQPIRIPLEVASAVANITRVLVSFSPGTILTNNLALDDVEYDTVGPPLPCTSTQPPTVTLTQPANSDIQQLNEFILEGTIITDAPLDDARVTATGSGASKSINLLANELVSHSGGSISSRIIGLLFPGSNTVTVEANNCRGTNHSSRTIALAPIASGTRFELMGLEITQAVQDINNTVALIADKRTVARAYLRVTGLTSEIRNLSGALTACHPIAEGSPLCGAFLPNLQSLNAVTVDSSTDITSKRRDINASLNFELLPDWIRAGRLHLRISHLEIRGTQLTLPCDNCDNPNPNFPGFPRFYDFKGAPSVRLRLIGVPYTITDPTGTSTTYNPRDVDFNLLTSWLRRAYPTSRLDIGPRTTAASFKGTPDVNFKCGDVNSTLEAMRKMDIAAGGDERSHYYALVSDAGGFLRGCSPVPGNVASGPAGSSDYGWDFDGSYADWYGGHELGHSFGRDHPWSGCSQDPESPGGDCPNPLQGTPPKLTATGCGHTPDDRNYPYPAPAPVASLDAPIGGPAADPTRFFGFDVGDASNGTDSGGTLVTPVRVYTPDTPVRWTDVMSYCNNEWISDYTYKGILDRLHSIEGTGSLPFTTVLGDGLFVRGIINLTQGSIRLEPFLRLPGLKATPRPGSSPFSIELLDLPGNVLALYPFEPKRLSDIPPGADEIALLNEVVPYVQGTSLIAISRNNIRLAARAISAHAPQVRVISPNGGETLTGLTTEVLWEATDADGDKLIYTLLYSNDAGHTWQTLATGIEESHFTAHATELAGGDHSLFRVIATDGVNTGMDDSDNTFRVPAKSPQARIISPGDRSTFSTTQTIVFSGEAFDVEDGNLDGQALQWNSDKQGALGSGRSLAATGLMPGTHIIRLEAKDQTGTVGIASIQIQITPIAPTIEGGLPRLSALVTSKSGLTNARLWAITLFNTGAGTAINAQISGMSMTQRFGSACRPVLASPVSFPLPVGDIPPGGSTSGTVVIDFSGCAATARFSVIIVFRANSGTISGSMTLNNQFR